MSDDDLATAFHHTVAQLLFMSSRAQRDIQTGVAFLTTRVKLPDEDDRRKLKYVLKYLNGTRNLELTLSLDDLGLVTWFVDASYTVHNDCRGQLGTMMTLGKGAVTNFSRKQRLNEKSSTEAELISVDSTMSQILWTRHFLEAQRYKVIENIIMHDNVPPTKLEQNDKASSFQKNKAY